MVDLCDMQSCAFRMASAVRRGKDGLNHDESDDEGFQRTFPFFKRVATEVRSNGVQVGKAPFR